ncbi:MAG TPA: DAK2 domain-containing protein [Jiangellaceae bacterium]|nr:DAK2 domain-containing protein [Jiangellaceae bacterium]
MSVAGVEPLLDARTVLRWCRAAQSGLAEAREEIDALNVYPVPDGDTGTNLYLTLESATQAAEQACADGAALIGPVLQAVARGALLGARGNSGVILSQMLRGVSEVLGSDDGSRPEPVVFAAALTRAADAGYAAVATPVEGTILTVARAAADAATARAGVPGATLPEVALAAAHAAREALARTPDQLEILRQAGVVDAGGRGLAVVLDAFDTVLTGRRPLAYPRAMGAPALPRVAVEAETADSSPSFEVMYLLDAPADTIPALRASLEPLGDSLIVVGGDPLWNVHVHVDDAGAAIEAGMVAGHPHRIRVTFLADRVGRPPATAEGRAVVAFAAGDGLGSLFESAGATVVRTPVGRRPSTAELLDAIRRSGAGEVVLLPNERDGVPVAEAAAAEARAEGTRVAVIPTRAQVQGIAATAVHEPARAFDADVVAMTAAAGHTRHGAVTVAAREAVTMAGVCRPGDILGIVEGDFVVIGTDLPAVAVDVVERMLSAGGELVTLVTGADAEPSLADGVVAALRRSHPEVDTVVYDGGQPRYPLLMGVE